MIQEGFSFLFSFVNISQWLIVLPYSFPDKFVIDQHRWLPNFCYVVNSYRIFRSNPLSGDARSHSLCCGPQIEPLSSHRCALLTNISYGTFFVLKCSVANLDPDPHGSASNGKLGSGSGSKWETRSGSAPPSASFCRWQAKIYGIWAYFSTFSRFWAFICKIVSGFGSDTQQSER